MGFKFFKMSSKAAGGNKRRTFRKFSYRGIDLSRLLDLSQEQFVALLNARPRRKFKNRGLERKRAAVGLVGEKPQVVKTHLRNMIILPEMIGSVLGIYNGRHFNAVEIKPEMVGTFTGEYAIT